MDSFPYSIEKKKNYSSLNYLKKNNINKIYKKNIFKNLNNSNKNYWRGFGFSKITNKY
jgi:hypothetical protein